MSWSINRYLATVPRDKLPARGPSRQISGTGTWYDFLWDVISPREYSRAPETWMPAARLTGKDLPVSGVARSEDGKRVMKVEFAPHYRKRNDLQREAEIIRTLNAAGCVSAPRLLEAGALPLDAIRAALPPDLAAALESAEVESFRYMTLEYVQSARSAPLDDIVATMLEQKSLGVYHADVKPDNLRFDDQKGICVLVDYDQATLLPEPVRSLNAEQFLHWCDQEDKARYPQGPGTWRRHFRGLISPWHLKPLLRDGAFNLAKTTPYRRQATTNTRNGVYHTISHPVVFADGVRDLRDRASLLDQVEFAAGERVLDVGCNAGLLVHYLAGRGCRATGMELDPAIVVSAQMIANVIGVSARFIARDLDEVPALETFDTICLFSVIHHTSKLEENGRKIAGACRRILIECRLSEHGKKPIAAPGGKVRWHETSVWDYPDEPALFAGLSGLFPGFAVHRRIGQADKGRMLLEMIKQ